MVSASEDEEGGEEVPAKNSSDEKKTTNAKEPTTNGKAKADSKAAGKKAEKVTPPAPKTKQGSIMSFFSKK